MCGFCCAPISIGQENSNISSIELRSLISSIQILSYKISNNKKKKKKNKKKKKKKKNTW